MSDIEFSRPFSVERLHGVAVTQSITANEKERAALAKRFGLVSVTRLESELTLSPPNIAALITVEGVVRATVTQTCILTAEDFVTEIETPVKSLFGTALAGTESDVESEWDAPDPIEHGTIDLGELAAQYLAVSLDPYPKKPGAEWTEMAEDSEELAPTSPFAVLQKLKDKPV